MLACLSPNGQNRFNGPYAPVRLLVATENGVSVLERPTAKGTWRKVAVTLPEVHATTLAGLPGQAGVFLGTHGDGVYFSIDQGASWEQRNNGLAIKDVYSVASVARKDATFVYAGTQPAHLFESRDLGLTWTELPALRQVPGTEHWTFPAPPRIAHTKMMVFDPKKPERFYCAIEQGAFLKTEDGGKSFREYAGYSREDDRAYRDIHQIMVVPSRPEIVYMTTGVGLYRSDDGGENWKRLTGPEFRLAYPDHIVLSPDERTLFLTGAREDPGVWRRTQVAETAIMRSRDGGASWEELRQGFSVEPRANIEAMTLASYPGGFTLLVGDTDGGVHTSEDGGDTWTRIADAVGPVTKGDHSALLQGRRMQQRAHA
ncbi:MAG TPA: hypothetical protein VLV50_01710 [Stellaceae bacterium]|nr:hypothetical protein [Stellaceae bacterium]